MSCKDLAAQGALAYLSGPNMAYVDSLYEDYLADPLSVSDDWAHVFQALQARGQQDVSHRAIRDYFLHLAQAPVSRKLSETSVGVCDDKARAVADLIHAYRTYGHHKAHLDPLELLKRPETPFLELSSYGLSPADFGKSFKVPSTIASEAMPLGQLLQALEETYCRSIGIEYMHIANRDEIAWLQNTIETVRAKPPISSTKKKAILESLIMADGLERYLGTRYVGQKRFSLEGGDALIPLMKTLIDEAGDAKVNEIVIGMAHRGRLNVLVNVLGKSPQALFQEFEGNVNLERTGDVKYHMGFSSDIKTASGAIVHLALAFNPSHLEIIDPVVEGSARVRLERRNDLVKKEKVLPLLIHGDAAIAGQGVVMETLNFSQARGYCTGGTVHIVINNQIGFTTSNPLDARSTLYCTDVAKMVQAPILHVNGDDPEAVVFASEIALAFRTRFKRDVVIDLVCYRRHGHNEADEPSVTQPVMYQKIKNMKPLREIYAKQLIAEGIVTEKMVEVAIEQYRDRLDKGESVVSLVQGDYPGKMSADWSPFLEGKWTDKADTTITPDMLHELSEQLDVLPQSFEVHMVVKKLLADRVKMGHGDMPINWGYAEIMAYATLLHQGYSVRLSGQDCGRGTFAHRHAVLHDINTGEIFVPLEHVTKKETSTFIAIDSVLSEEAVLAFEYGYACSAPKSLVLWEAQFGDFANGAQVVIDQFISSGEQKWGRLCGLVMLLPHGYEGQGPEHSSARLERYMQLCAQNNMQVCTPTTPAQMFHLLRRQMIRDFRKPLIVMTPKSLLRHKLAVSSCEELYTGQFNTVIPEVEKLTPKNVRRIILCCGKVYYDLLQKRQDEKLDNVAIIRIEQLYPFPKAALRKALSVFPLAKDIIWCQEEPKNQGVWYSSQHNMKDCLNDNQSLRYVGRSFAASPAVGSAVLHAKQQNELVESALMGVNEC